MTEPDLRAGLPADRPAEQAILGSVLLTGDALDRAVEDKLTAADFDDGRHAVIYTAMLVMSSAGESIDPVTLADHLDRSGELARIGGFAYLHELLAATPSAATVGHYIDIVRRLAFRRRLAAAGTRITQLALTAVDYDQHDLLGGAEDALRTATDGADFGAGSGIGDGLDELIDAIETGTTAMATPWRELNGLIGGWTAGNLYVIGGYVGGGKSIAGLQAAVDVARRHGQLAIYLSMEMTEEQLKTRAFAQLGLADLGRLNRGGGAVSEMDWRGIARARKIMETGGRDGGPLPLYLAAQSGMTLADMRAGIRAGARMFHQPPGLVVVDFMQLARGAGRPESRRVEVDQLAYALKGLALDLRIPVLALAQVNRSPETGNRKPRMSDLRESGAIEQAADAVLLLSRDEEQESGGAVTIAVPKHRNGPTGEVQLRWEGQFARFLDPPRDTEGAVLP